MPMSHELVAAIAAVTLNRRSCVTNECLGAQPRLTLLTLTIGSWTNPVASCDCRPPRIASDRTRMSTVTACSMEDAMDVDSSVDEDFC